MSLPVTAFSLFSTRKRERKAVKTPVREWLAVVGYYPKLNQLVSGLMHHDILTGSAKSFADLNAQVERPASVVQRLLAHMAVKASGVFVLPSAFAAGTGKAFTCAYAWNAPREAVGRGRPLTRDEMRQVQGVLSTINRPPQLFVLAVYFTL